MLPLGEFPVRLRLRERQFSFPKDGALLQHRVPLRRDTVLMLDTRLGGCGLLLTIVLYAYTNRGNGRINKGFPATHCSINLVTITSSEGPVSKPILESILATPGRVCEIRSP